MIYTRDPYKNPETATYVTAYYEINSIKLTIERINYYEDLQDYS